MSKNYSKSLDSKPLKELEQSVMNYMQDYQKAR